jgi:hypothetical protein
MTLEQTTRLVLAAVELQDLEALQAAGKARESAIAGLNLLAPTPALRDAVAASIAAGDEARKSIRVIRQRIRKESRRLANIEHGFLRALVPWATHQVDCKG